MPTLGSTTREVVKSKQHQVWPVAHCWLDCPPNLVCAVQKEVHGGVTLPHSLGAEGKSFGQLCVAYFLTISRNTHSQSDGGEKRYGYHHNHADQLRLHGNTSFRYFVDITRLAHEINIGRAVDRVKKWRGRPSVRLSKLRMVAWRSTRSWFVATGRWTTHNAVISQFFIYLIQEDCCLAWVSV